MFLQNGKAFFKYKLAMMTIKELEWYHSSSQELVE